MILHYKVITPQLIFTYHRTRKQVTYDKQARSCPMTRENYFDARKLPFDSSLRIRLREVSVIPR